MEWPSGVVGPPEAGPAAAVPVMGAPPRFAFSAAATDVAPAGPLVTTWLSLANNREHKNRICACRMSAAALASVMLPARGVLLARNLLFAPDLASPFPPSAVAAPTTLPLAAAAPDAMPLPDAPLLRDPVPPALLFA